MKFGLTLLTAFVFTGLFLPAKGLANVEIGSALVRRNDLYLTTQVVRPFLYDRQVIGRLESWLTHDKINAYLVDCQFHLRAFFRTEKIIGPLCYLLRQDDATRRGQYFSLVKRYVLEVGAALAELGDDPRYSQADRAKAKSWASHFRDNHDQALKDCFAPALRTRYPQDGSLPYAPFSSVARCFHQSLPKIGASPYFAVNIAKEFVHHPGHAISPVGWVSGNKVTYLTYNATSAEVASALADRHGQMRQHYPLDGAGSLASMRRREEADVFTAREGFFDIDSDPTWTDGADRPEAIFPAFKRAIDAARESVFIDIFFLGGSSGASLAKHLVKTAERGVKVLVLRDNYNHFGHEPEMLPVFNFLKAYSQKHPDKMVVSAAYIKAHTSGLPRFMADVVSDEFIEQTGLQNHLSLYARAMSDHSKVFVIDGKSANSVAFVGSKNITDASGAVVYDEVVQVEGPIAAVVLDDYYFDMALALKFETSLDDLKSMAQRGWSGSKFRPGQSQEEMIANILIPFDLLGRDKNGAAQNAQVAVPAKGTAVIRTGYNNVDSSRTNTVDQVIQMIKHARKRIFIKDQYLFDRNVVLALVHAKKARPELDIKVLLEPMQRATPKGLPNLLYLDILTASGIEVKWKTLIEHSGTINQEYHMKSISSDGTSVISGSANKDQTTMYGAFREEQLDIWDEAATKVHDDALLDYWNDPNASTPFRGFDFAVPGDLKGLDGKPMTPDEFIKLLRNVVSLLFDATRL